MDLSVVRTEKKYSITWSQQSTLVHRLQAMLDRDPYGGAEGYRVRSLYFDSIYDDDYFDKVNGLECRKKIRLRIYDPEQEEVKLEIKKKQGAVQKKESLLLSKIVAERMIQGDYTGLLSIDSELAIRLYQMLEMGLYRPKCIIEYQRVAFVEQCNRIRITVDSDINVAWNCENFWKHDLDFLPIRKQPVLEVKYDRFLLSNLKQLFDVVDAPEIAISKYAMARQLFG